MNKKKDDFWKYLVWLWFLRKNLFKYIYIYIKKHCLIPWAKDHSWINYYWTDGRRRNAHVCVHRPVMRWIRFGQTVARRGRSEWVARLKKNRLKFSDAVREILHVSRESPDVINFEGRCKSLLHKRQNRKIYSLLVWS